MHVVMKGCDIEGLRCTHRYCIFSLHVHFYVHASLPMFERILNHSCDCLDSVRAFTFAARDIATRL